MATIPVVIYEQIERAIIDRLRQGLGKMVRQVVSYSGELDDDLGAVVRALPAAWVTFGGIQSSKQMATNKQKILCTGTFVVMVANQSVRSDTAGRHTLRANEVGTNSLVWAVRRLLAYQELGLEINPIRPVRVRSLFNVSLRNQAISGYACEFEVDWIEEALPNNAWPSPFRCLTDGLYQLYGGHVDKPDNQLTHIHLSVFDDAQSVEGGVNLKETNDES